MTDGLPGWERKSRGIFEGKEWAQSLQDAGITPRVWDERFLFAIVNISERPLENTHPFLEHSHRLIQVSLPNELIGDVYFRIEPDDDNCTLLWIEAKRIAASASALYGSPIAAMLARQFLLPEVLLNLAEHVRFMPGMKHKGGAPKGAPSGFVA